MHGSLEGPEHAIYVRGTIETEEKGCLVELPEYWSAMCEDYTVQLTPHGPYTVFIKEKLKDKVMIECSQKKISSSIIISLVQELTRLWRWYKMPSASDVYITPASKKIEFYESSAVKGKVYQDGSYFRIRSEGVPLAFEGDSGNHYFIRGSAQNRLFVYNYSAGTGYGTYAADYLELRDGSSNREAYVVAGNGSFVSGNFAIGTSSAGEKLHVEGTTRITGKATLGLQQCLLIMVFELMILLNIPQQGGDPTYVANAGVVWVKSTSPTTLWFTASDGTDTDLTAGGGGTIGGTISSGKLAIGTGTDTIGNFVDALTENDSIYIGANPASTTNTAQNNTALGISALNDITTGDNNTAIGIQAGQKTTTQERNTIIGVSALRYASGSASYNVAIGYATMGASDQEGSQNTAVGYYALSGATGANAVTAVGHLAARDLTTGDSHVAIGKSAMLKVTTSSYNTVVGVDALSDVDGAGSTPQ